ncbi:MAG: prephenate dehydrogenase/arogenate dehydrogenase family protein [Planctomycetia bacterium]|nr:prephenate dehydrogenase/arogenate dehydrogenase family protein [Planctomycetia bacterium]
MKHWDTVAIVGVGLIGGSIGLDLLAQKTARRVVGIGHRAASLATAERVGAVTETTLDLAQGVAAAELVVVCTPVGRIVDDVLTVAQACKPGTLITDVGSTKRSIVRGLAGRLPAGVTFVGSHPIAGSEKSGPEAAMRGLFQDRVTVVTPAANDALKNDALNNETAAKEAIVEFWKSLGSRVVEMTPEAHDQALAATSHVPHVVASALAGTTPEFYLDFAAGGWRDTTRIAASDSSLWRQILGDNRVEVIAALQLVQTRLAEFLTALESRDDAAVERLLTLGRERRASLTN